MSITALLAALAYFRSLNGDGPGLRPSDRLVLLMFCDHANEEAGRLAWPGAKCVAHETGLSERAVRSAIHRLVAAGLLVLEKPAGRHSPPAYRPATAAPLVADRPATAAPLTAGRPAPVAVRGAENDAVDLHRLQLNQEVLTRKETGTAPAARALSENGNGSGHGDGNGPARLSDAEWRRRNKLVNAMNPTRTPAFRMVGR